MIDRPMIDPRAVKMIMTIAFASTTGVPMPRAHTIATAEVKGGGADTGAKPFGSNCTSWILSQPPIDFHTRLQTRKEKRDQGLVRDSILEHLMSEGQREPTRLVRSGGVILTSP